MTVRFVCVYDEDGAVALFFSRRITATRTRFKGLYPRYGAFFFCKNFFSPDIKTKDWKDLLFENFLKKKNNNNKNA